MGDMDLVEVNEAFAGQYMAVEKELGLDPAITNVNGGAIAITHPLAASGARITIHLLHELRRRRGRYGLGAACIGAGFTLRTRMGMSLPFGQMAKRLLLAESSRRLTVNMQARAYWGEKN